MIRRLILLALLFTTPSLCSSLKAQQDYPAYSALPGPGAHVPLCRTLGDCALADSMGTLAPPASDEASPCPAAEPLSELAYVTCKRGGFTVTYPNPDQILVCSSTGGAPVVTAADVEVVSDPGGPDAILFGPFPWGKSWIVAAGEKLECTVNFTLTAPQGITGLAQLGASATGDAYVYMANDVYTSPKTVSGISCVAGSCPGDNWAQSFIHFTPGTYAADLTFTLNGAAGKGGRVTLLMLSEHFW